jgi:uncharacterized protein (TIGR02246 family)
MKRLFLIVAVLSYGIIANAQTKSDEEALRALPHAFCDAWAKHDGHQLATIMAEDVDFVTVGGTWFHGKADFEKYHTRLLAGRFRESTNTPLETVVRFLRSDEGVVHWSWTIEGDKNPDGSPRPKRFGIMTMVAKKQGGAWLVAVAQNTNAGPGAPEADDIKVPIRLPKAAPKP